MKPLKVVPNVEVRNPFVVPDPVPVPVPETVPEADSSDSESEDELPEYGCLVNDVADDPVDDGDSLFELMAQWATKFNIPQGAVNAVIAVVNKFVPAEHRLPKDARTLLRTPRNIQTKIVDQGELWYYGVAKCIRNLADVAELDGVVQLSFNFDGLPIYGSAAKKFLAAVNASNEAGNSCNCCRCVVWHWKTHRSKIFGGFRCRDVGIVA